MSDAITYARACRMNGYSTGVIRRALAIEYALDEEEIEVVLRDSLSTISHDEFVKRNHEKEK